MQIFNSLNEGQMSREKFMAIIDAYGGPAKFLQLAAAGRNNLNLADLKQSTVDLLI